MFDRPHLLWLLALAPLAAAPGILAMRTGLRLAGAASATLRALCVVALVAMLAGLRIPGRIAAQSVAVVAVMDESRSVSPDQQEWMRGQIENLKTAMAPTDRLGIVGFGRDARLLAPLTDPRVLGNFGDGVDGGATNIAGALTAAESLYPPEADKRILLLSDGNETEDSAITEVPAM
ncbi:vWA domain-containing protein, partial [Candidatus Binatus sp.]|uniref:vWA domain-containing protein n=1 Tax=Candidatus Binatus sp. TaxID=2811406 RepID=UPI003C92C5DE